jgi:hypothetical protein
VATICGEPSSSGGEDGDTSNDESQINRERGGSQYFLITPKLLPNLQYHERMKVIVVNNGEYLPSSDQWKSCHGDRWVEMAA